MAMRKVVERQTGVALWRQIADRIRLAISNGDYDAPGESCSIESSSASAWRATISVEART